MKLSEEKGKENPFSVPEDYFDTLADRTMAAINEQAGKGKDWAVIKVVAGKGEDWATITEGDGKAAIREEKLRKPGMIVRLKPFLALAAAILGFAILASALVRLINVDRPDRVSDSGNSLYADLAVEEIGTYMLEDELNMTDPVITEITGETISSETINDYLMTEDINIDDIYELLL